MSHQGAHLNYAHELIMKPVSKVQFLSAPSVPIWSWRLDLTWLELDQVSITSCEQEGGMEQEGRGGGQERKKLRDRENIFVQ